MTNATHRHQFAFQWMALFAATLLIAGVLPCSAQDGDSLNPGIFGVIVRDNLTQAKTIIGTAFLLDRQQGYVLTAAHVIKGHLKKADDPILLQMNVRLPLDSIGEDHSLEMSAKVVACKYDYVSGSAPSKRNDDWALLKIDDKDGNRFALDFFRSVAIDPDMTETDLKNRPFEIWGFPGGNPLHQGGRFWNAESDNTFLGSLDAHPGNSGGPCILGQSALLLGGVALELGTLQRNGVFLQNSVRILPPYLFLGDMATSAPESERVSSIVARLKQPQPDSDAVARDAIRTYIALSQMTGLEHMQLQLKLKNDRAIPNSGIVQLIYSFYRQFRKPSLAQTLMEGREGLAVLMHQRAHATVAAIKAANQTTENELQWSLAVENCVVDAYRRKTPNGLSNKTVSNAATNCVYLFAQLHKPTEVDQWSIDNIRLAASLDPANHDLLTWIAVLEKAVTAKVLEEAIKAEPSDPEPYIILGSIALQQQRAAEATLAFDNAGKLLAKYPNTKRKKALEQQVLGGIAQVAESRGDWKKAESPLRNLLALAPDDLVCRQRLARAFFRQGKTQDAYEVLKAAKQIDRQNAGRHDTREVVLTPEAIMGKYYDELEGPKSTNAERWFKAALTAAPDDLATRQAVATWALEKGDIASAKEQAEAALRIEASEKRQRGGNVSHMLRGVVALLEKDWPVAEEQFQKIIDASPQDFVARNNLALALVEQDDPAKKQRALDFAEANYRVNKGPEALSTLGWVYFRDGEFDKARLALNQAVKVTGGNLNNADTTTYLAHVLYHQGQRYQAKKLLDNILKGDRPFSMRPEAEKLYEKVKDEKKPEGAPAAKAP
jgi:tetratricopeptide (TPR) repeat protein